MEIEAYIDYYGSSVATFDPQKVLVRLNDAFSGIHIEYHDLAQDEVERLIKFLDTQETPEPSRSTMLRQIRDKAARNGPIYTFQLEMPHRNVLSGYVRRYHVLFRSEKELDVVNELVIIRFLLSLHLGVLRSDTPTSYFCLPHPDYPNYWLLAEDKLPPSDADKPTPISA